MAAMALQSSLLRGSSLQLCCLRAKDIKRIKSLSEAVLWKSLSQAAPAVSEAGGRSHTCLSGEIDN